MTGIVPLALGTWQLELQLAQYVCGNVPHTVHTASPALPTACLSWEHSLPGSAAGVADWVGAGVSMDCAIKTTTFCGQGLKKGSHDPTSHR